MSIVDPPSTAIEPQWRWTEIALLALAAVLFVALRVPVLHIPLERDEGEYAYFAQRTLAGDMPYRDMFNQKPPGIFLLYLVPVGLFGTSVAAIHVTLYVWTALTAVAVYAVARQLVGRQPAAFAMPLFAVLSQSPVWRATAANTEQFMLLPLALSVAAALRALRGGKSVWWGVAGFMAMSACWFKQIAVLYFPLLAALLVAGCGWSLARLFKGIATAALGVVLAAVPVLAYFAAKGVWNEFLDAVWRHNVTYATTITWERGRPLLVDEFRNQYPSHWLYWLLALPVLLDWRRAQRRSSGVLAGWMLAALAGASIGLRFFSHYYVPCGPPLAIAGGIVLARLQGTMFAGWRQWGGAMTASALAFVAVLPQLLHDRQLYGATPAQQAQMLYYDAPFDHSAAIAAHIQKHTTPDERVLIFGSEPQILFLAERVSATRYIIFYPLMIPGDESEKRQERVWEEISAAPPKCVLMSEANDSLLEQPDSPGRLRRKLGRMLSLDYELSGLRLGHGHRSRMLFDEAAREAFNAADDAQRVRDMSFFVFVKREAN